MKKINYLNKLLFVGFVTLSSNTPQVFGMSYVASFKNLLSNNRLVNGVKARYNTYIKGKQKESPSWFQQAKAGANYVTSGLKSSANKISTLVDNHRFATGMVGVAACGLTLIHPKIRKCVQNRGLKLVDFVRNCSFSNLMPWIKNHRRQILCAGAASLTVPLGYLASKALSKLAIRNERQALNNIAALADEFLRNITRAAEHRDAVQTIITAQSPIERMRPILRNYEHTAWAQLISAALDQETLRWGNLFYSLDGLYRFYMDYVVNGEGNGPSTSTQIVVQVPPSVEVIQAIGEILAENMGSVRAGATQAFAQL